MQLLERFGDIGYAVQIIVKPSLYGVVREFVVMVLAKYA
jgi:hypothetical protein